MGNEAQELAALTGKQRQRVERNMGLVGVHIRRHVANLREPRHDREWDDLFQEGCLGLMAATKRYDENSGIEFAAYALPRIHNAVSRALYRRFSTVYIPPRRRAGKAESDDGERRSASPVDSRPRVTALPDDVSSCWEDRRRHNPTDESLETIGDRMRVRYEQALKTAASSVRRCGRRNDGGELVARLVQGRFLVPNDEDRTPLRQLARETHSSYARVAQCDKKIAGAVRDQLERDPEFAELQRQQRRSEDGVHCPLDAAVEQSIANSEILALSKRYAGADRNGRAVMLAVLLEMAGRAVDQVLAHLLGRLSSGERKTLLAETQ